MHLDDTANNDLVYGRNAVIEALKSHRFADRLLLARGERSGSLGRIVALCKEQGVPVKEVAVQKLDTLTGGAVHQGVALFCAAHGYAELEDLFERAAEKGEAPFFILCDELEDPHNLGAIIRTAEAAGAHGVIVPKRRCAPLSGVAAKAACGALEYVPVARVQNIAACMEELKQRGLFCYGADMGGQTWCEVDYSGPVCLVIGAEGKGIGRLVREKCDFLISLPMKGHISSLNASVAAGVLMYEISRQRAGLQSR